MDPVSLFATLIVVGLFMLAVEVIVPGGVVGALGFLALLAACAISYKAFGFKTGMVSTVSIMIGSVIIIALWIKYLPTSPIGRIITLSESPTPETPRPFEHSELLDKEGEAVTDLRPGGIARIEGKRIDVVADNDWIEPGQPVKVVKVEGNRIVVRQQA